MVSKAVIFVSVLAVIAVIAAGIFIVRDINLPASTPQPHLNIQSITVLSYNYTNAMLSIRIANNTTIQSYQIWCDSDKYSNNIKWIFASGQPTNVDVYSAATPTNHYANFTPSDNPYHLTLYTMPNEQGISETYNFSV